MHLLIFLLCVWTGASWANQNLTPQELKDMTLVELLQVKISSSGYFEPDSRLSPGMPFILTNEELENNAILRLRDVFETYVPSTTISYTHFAGPKTGVRGIDTDNNAKTIFMVNGQNLNPKNHYGYQAGLQGVLLGDIDHFEIIQGPGSLLHGSGAINSVVNAKSKNGGDNPGTYFGTGYGMRESLKYQELGQGKNFGPRRNLYLYGGFAQSDGFRPNQFMEKSKSDFDPDETFVPIQKMPLQVKASAYLNWDSLHLQTQYSGLTHSRNNIQTGNGTLNKDEYWQKYWATRLEYTWALAKNLRLKFSLPFNILDHGLRFYESEIRKVGSQLHMASRNTLFWETGKHQWAGGFGLGLKRFDAGHQYFGEDSPYTEEIVDATLKESELFSEYTLRATRKFSLTAGARLDYVQYQNMRLVDLEEVPQGVKLAADDLLALSHRLALVYLIDKQQTAKASYQEGFRYPDVGYFRYLGLINASLKQAGFDPVGQLEPEKVKSLQANYLYQFNSLPLNLDATVFYSRYSNILDWAEWPREMFATEEEYRAAYAGIPWNHIADSIPIDEYYVESYRNSSDDIDAWGLDIGANLLLGNRFHLRGSYGFSRPGPTDSDEATLVLMNAEKNRWASFPEHLFKASITHNPLPQFGYHISSYVATPVDICNQADCESSEQTIDFHEQLRLRLNANIRYTYQEKINFRFHILNLLEDAGPPVGAESRYGPSNTGAAGDGNRYYYFTADLNF